MFLNIIFLNIREILTEQTFSTYMKHFLYVNQLTYDLLLIIFHVFGAIKFYCTINFHFSLVYLSLDIFIT